MSPTATSVACAPGPTPPPAKRSPPNPHHADPQPDSERAVLPRFASGSISVKRLRESASRSADLLYVREVAPTRVRGESHGIEQRAQRDTQSVGEREPVAGAP